MIVMLCRAYIHNALPVTGKQKLPRHPFVANAFVACTSSNHIIVLSRIAHVVLQDEAAVQGIYKDFLARTKHNVAADIVDKSALCAELASRKWLFPIPSVYANAALLT